MEIERQIAKDGNSLSAFQKKWSRLKSTTSRNQFITHETHLPCVEINVAPVDLFMFCV